MGFVLGTLGPGDGNVIRALQQPIITTLRRGSDRVRNGTADANCTLWFGANPITAAATTTRSSPHRPMPPSTISSSTRSECRDGGTDILPGYVND